MVLLIGDDLLTITDIIAIPQTAEAIYFTSQNLKVWDFLSGEHKVLQRPDFSFKGEAFNTAKTVLQTAKSIVDFHTSYLVGNPVTLTGDSDAVKAFNNIYSRSDYALIDYQIVDSLVKYGNAFEYVYKGTEGICSRVFDPLCAYPVYDEKGVYRAFLEYWRDAVSGNEYYVLYEPDTVTEYSTTGSSGTLAKDAQYRNLTGLPVHYTSGVPAPYSPYGVGLVVDLIPIVDELEQLLSKTSDAVTTLSLNPLGVSAGQRIDASIDKDVVGATLNLEDGGKFDFASAMIDSATVSFLYNQLINQLYAVAQVPSIVFNGNVSNVSEVSLKLLFTQLDNKAKRQSAFLRQGFYKRWDAMRRLMPSDALTDAQFDTLDISFNLGRPTDNTAIVADLVRQYDAGALSRKTFIEQSPYTNDADAELAQIKKEQERNDNVPI